MSSKQREALLAVYDCAKDGVLTIRESAFEKVVEALAEPLRNCDVGTPKEQTERFNDLCRKYRRGPGPRANCKGCPIEHESLHVGCTLAWAQLPYESEVK